MKNRLFESVARGLSGKLGKTYFVSDTTGAFWNDLNLRYPPDVDGKKKVYSTVTLALAACTAAYGEYIVLAPDFTTVLTATEEDDAATKGVRFIWTRNEDSGTYFANRATATPPASAVGSLFTVTGKIKLLNIIGEVTTATQDQACNLTLSSVPTSALTSSVLAAATSIRNNSVGAMWNITGTVANSMVTTTAVGISQATAQIIPAGTIKAQTSATNTGSVKWHVVYKPIDPGARVIPA